MVNNLQLSIDKEINIEHCLTFPLAPMSLALFSCADKMLKTDKSVLAKILKSEMKMVEPVETDVEIMDDFTFYILLDPLCYKPSKDSRTYSYETFFNQCPINTHNI